VSDQYFSIDITDGGGSTTATTERLRITQAGDVGIGTTSPSTKLEVSGTAKATGIIIADDGNIGSASDTDAIAIASNGRATFTKSPIFNEDISVLDDIFLLTDNSVIWFGLNYEISLTHVHDVGLNLKHTATGDDKPIILTLQTGETDLAYNDVIGTLNFQAPDEAAGGDANLVAAGIEARAEGDFSATNNRTQLSFKTAASEAATEKMRLDSYGTLSLPTDHHAGIYFGADNDVVLFHVHNSGLRLLHVGGTGDNSPIKFTLQSYEDDIELDDVIGILDFQAEGEDSGGDANLVCAGIEAVSEGDFSATNNATSLVFKTGASETATAKVKITSAGHLVPNVDDTYDLGTSELRWREVFTGDLNLSNMSKTEGNKVDGTKGNWTIQEGDEDLYIINNNTNKKYKFNLTEI
jgi:hypothetical protein